MNNWEGKKKLRSFLYSKTFLFVLMIVIIFSIKGTWNLYQKNLEAKARKELIGGQLQELKLRGEFLKANLSELNSQSGVEAILREKFNVKKQGEEVAIIINSESQKETNESGRISSFLQHFFTGFVDIFR